MSSYDAGEITTNGVSVPIKVTDDGDWTAEYAGQHLRTDSRDKLKGRLARLTRSSKVEVAVPVVKVRLAGLGNDTVVVTRGVAYGLHGGTGNVMVTWTIKGKETKEQLSSYGYSETYIAGDVTDEELKDYAAMMKAKAELRSREEGWLKRHRIDPKKAVQQAIEARMGTED